MQEIGDTIEKLLAQIEELGCEGKVEEAQDIMKKVESLKEEKSALKRDNLPMHWIQQRAEIGAAQEKQMEVCDVCGAFLIVNDVQQRVDDHLMGKQHVGYGKLKTALDEILQKRKLNRSKEGVDDNRQRDKSIKRSRSNSRSKSRSNSRSKTRSRSVSREKTRSRSASRDRHKDRNGSSKYKDHGKRYNSYRHSDKKNSLHSSRHQKHLERSSNDKRSHSTLSSSSSSYKHRHRSRSRSRSPSSTKRKEKS